MPSRLRRSGTVDHGFTRDDWLLGLTLDQHGWLTLDQHGWLSLDQHWWLSLDQHWWLTLVRNHRYTLVRNNQDDHPAEGSSGESIAEWEFKIIFCPQGRQSSKKVIKHCITAYSKYQIFLPSHTIFAPETKFSTIVKKNGEKWRKVGN